MELVPRIAEDVNRKRIERLQQTLARKAGGECLANSPNTQVEPESPVSSRVIAASMMGVGDNYVGLAKRVREPSREFFEEVRAGELTLSEAIRRLDGLTDDARAVRVKAVRRKVRMLSGETLRMSPPQCHRKRRTQRVKWGIWFSRASRRSARNV